jgi:hypothetical protein
MIANAREMSMVCENRLFIVDARASADTFRRSLKCEKCGLEQKHPTSGFGLSRQPSNESPPAAQPPFAAETP